MTRSPNTSSRSTCVLVSGGVDSSILVAEMLARGREVWPLYVRGGFFWERAELHWVKRFLGALAGKRLKPLTVVEARLADFFPKHWSVTGRGAPQARSAWESVYLPGRNLILLSQAGVFCALHEIPAVALGVLKGNPFRDAQPRFVRAMGAAISAALGARVRIELPFARLSKSQVLERAGRAPLALTFSCLRPRGVRACGVCHKCEERRVAETRRFSGRARRS